MVVDHQSAWLVFEHSVDPDYLKRDEARKTDLRMQRMKAGKKRKIAGIYRTPGDRRGNYEFHKTPQITTNIRNDESLDMPLEALGSVR